MSKRITEAELTAFETAASGLVDMCDSGDAPSVEFSIRLGGEVRRLRGLIVLATDDPPREDQTGKPEGPLYDALMRHKRAVQELEAEARAIRCERGQVESQSPKDSAAKS